MRCPFVTLVIGVLLVSGCTALDPTDGGAPRTETFNVPYELTVGNADNQTYELVVTVRREATNEVTHNVTIEIPASGKGVTSVERNLTYPAAGEYLVEASLNNSASATYLYEASGTDPESAIAIGISNGELDIATYYT